MCGFVAICLCAHARESSCGPDHGFNKHSKHTNDAANHSTKDAQVNDMAEGLQASIETIKHRGPDGSDIWINTDKSAGLAHCRLSIIDLSSRGRQPIHSDDDQIHAVVNGEIYDHERLRTALMDEHGYKFASDSDSELILALYQIHGTPAFFEHLRGEFAFVIVDERPGSRRVVAGRDRFGVKPLFWTVVGQKILLASEIKAFLPLGWSPEWNVRSIADVGWMIDDRTIFKNVRKLMPGHWMDITDQQGPKIYKYWDADYPIKSEVDPRPIDDMILEVRQRLVESVRLRLRADVPVGVYLSGGIDSSVIAGIANELSLNDHVKVGKTSSSCIPCFTIRFPHDSGHDESDIAHRTAKALGMELFERFVDENTLAENFGDAVYHSEHHLIDLNGVAKFALSSLVRDHGVKVVITGEGSDEHFAGYPYFFAEYLREPDLSMPGDSLARCATLREKLHQSTSTEMSAICRSIGNTESSNSGSSELLSDADKSTMPESILTWRPSETLFLKDIKDNYLGTFDRRETIVKSHLPGVRKKMREEWHPAHSAMYMWNKSALPNVILSSLGDRTEMAHCVEGRPPFLDHYLTEYVNSLPPSLKMKYIPVNETAEDSESNYWWKSSGSGLKAITEKWILREAARPYITEELYKRRKVPFMAPTRWSKNGPLENLFKKLLTSEAVENLGFVDFGVVKGALEIAFGADSDPVAFRIVCNVSCWIVLAEKFGIAKASAQDLRCS